MHRTEENLSEIYESIAVVVIYLPNLAEVLLENERELLIGECREIFEKCLEIMRQEEAYRDWVVHSSYMYGIFHEYFSGKGEGAVNAAGRINIMLRDMNRKRNKDLEKICFGIGVAEGNGGRLLLKETGREDKAIWIGKVLEDARALAQMALCDGLARVRVADGMFYDIFKG